ncbi:hypothetical protein [Actinoplanes flavus]|uniref:GNAT family N-acetyltransferase n=1 Tax=Actinoplanes flavus TaxID=2820290 RepID=A0ABS3UZW3_9ACTN|nr:hypothetical protein [Actinoplanes flavus]MBO3744120.1 hypothetical protein [Actinoplanes flavus]
MPSDMSVPIPSTLPWTNPASFRVWRYGIGHSRLLLTSRSGLDSIAHIDLLFEDVQFIQLHRDYRGIRVAEDPAALTEVAIRNPLGIAYLAVAISDATRTGLVICSRVTITSQHRRSGQGPDDFEAEVLVQQRTGRPA